MPSDRLSPLDASFLHLEDAASHMHVAAAMVFDGDAPAYDDLLEHVDLPYHVRNTALPAPGSEYELQVLAGRIFSQPLRRDRPLWEMWLVHGLEGGRFAILSKTHHALVDGISGLDILA